MPVWCLPEQKPLVSDEPRYTPASLLVCPVTAPVCRFFGAAGSNTLLVSHPTHSQEWADIIYVGLKKKKNGTNNVHSCVERSILCR